MQKIDMRLFFKTVMVVFVASVAFVCAACHGGGKALK